MNVLMVSRNLKFVLDRAAAACLLLLLSPVMLLLSLLVWAAMGRPVFFRQQRLGFRRRVFEVCKFRTMLESPGLSDAERLTTVGRFLRRSGFDELPQLIQILSGAMSFVGPRPLVARYGPFFSATEHQRHDARPGLTGWAQIHGRHQAGWQQRLERDVWYVEHWSLALDALILWRTVGLLVSGRGFEQTPTATMVDLDVERSAGAGGSQ